MIELKVGDKLFYTSRWGNDAFGYIEIERVTAKQAFTKSGMKFKKFQDNGTFIKRIGYDSWNNTTYSLETDFIKEKYHKYKMLQEIEEIKFKDLDTEKLEKIVSVIRGV